MKKYKKTIGASGSPSAAHWRFRVDPAMWRSIGCREINLETLIKLIHSMIATRQVLPCNNVLNNEAHDCFQLQIQISYFRNIVELYM